VSDIGNGEYSARAISWDFGQTKKGENQIAILFGLLDDPTKRLTYYGQFGEKTLKHTMKALRACGWRGSDLSELFGGAGGLDEKDVMLVVENEEWDGKIRTRIKWVNPLGVSMESPLDAAGMKAFAASMKAKIVALDPASAKVKAAPKSVPVPKPTGGDDIPF
jgi:hypothetical protein